MAPLSVLPGRIRYECASLLGRKELSHSLQRELASIVGVTMVLANHRTGRILIRFDEEAVSQEVIAAGIKDVLSSRSAGKASPRCGSADSMGETGGTPPKFAGQWLVGLMAHILLPKPLDLLLPSAVAVFRRRPS